MSNRDWGTFPDLTSTKTSEGLLLSSLLMNPMASL